MTTLRLTIPIPPSEWLSANDRRHWADVAARTKSLRLRARLLAHGLPRFEQVHVSAEIGYPSGGRADPANAAPTVKACLDGMTDAGLWPDDDSEHVVAVEYRRGLSTGRKGWHTVSLVLTEQTVAW